MITKADSRFLTPCGNLFSLELCATKVLAAYFRIMNLSHEHQELVDFFSGLELPTGPQHINEYSVMLNLAGAVHTRLQQLNSEVEATRKSAVLMLSEVKAWLLENAKPDGLEQPYNHTIRVEEYK